MSEMNAWTNLEYSRKNPFNPEVTPLRYSIPYEWGNLGVTEAAEESYGFVPLSANVIKSPAPPCRKDRTQQHIDILILGPQEIPMKADAVGDIPPLVEEGDSEDEHEMVEILHPMGGHIGTKLWKRGISVQVGFTSNIADLKASVLEELADANEQDVEELDRRSLLHQGAPISESLEYDLRQQLIHMTGHMVQQQVSFAYHEFSRMHEGRRFSNSGLPFWALGTFAVALTGASEVGTTMNPAQAMILPGLMGGMYMGAQLMSNRRYLKGMNRREHMRQVEGDMLGRVVAGDLHQTFCTSHFDHMARGMLGEDAPEA